MDTSEAASSSGYELSNNMEFLYTPVKDFATCDYKKLQTFVAAMGLPSNLKRKQLLAIIVAKKKGKDNMIPTILKEVTRQRNQKKKYVREIIHRHKLNEANRPFPPKIAPLPPQVVSNKAVPLAHSFMAPITDSEPHNLKLLYRRKYTKNNNSPARRNKNLNAGKGSQNCNEASTSRNTIQTDPAHQSLRSTPSTSTVKSPVYAYYYDINITKKYITLPLSTYISTRRILTIHPITRSTQWYRRLVSSTREGQSTFIPHIQPLRINAMSPPQSNQEGHDNTTQQSDELDDDPLNDFNLDEILDFVMGEEDRENFRINFHEPPDVYPSVSNDSDTDSASSLREMQLYNYYDTLATRALWPLKGRTFVMNSVNTRIFDVLSPINSDTNTTNSCPTRGIPSAYETLSAFRPRACIYPETYSAPQTLPDRCLLEPEHSLSYDVPEMYYSSRNYGQEYNAAHALNNYCYSANQEQDLSRFAYSSPLIHYNVHLPTDTNANEEPAIAGSSNYVEMRPRAIRGRGLMLQEIEPTISPLTREEEAMAYNSLGDVAYENFQIQETSRAIHHAEHAGQCCNYKISCPFLFSYCQWYDNIPGMAKHIRTMHSEKIVYKKCAEYYINFIQLELLGHRGIKIVQEYGNRLCCMSLCYSRGKVIVVIQEICESLECHGDTLKCMMLMKHLTGNRVWSGFVNKMTIPVAQLWRDETALLIPTARLKTFAFRHFRLVVNIGN